MGDETLRTICKQFRLTTVVFVLLQSAFIVLFGVFVRYDKIYGLPAKLPASASPQDTNISSSTGIMMSLTSPNPIPSLNMSTTGANNSTVAPLNSNTSSMSSTVSSSQLPSAISPSTSIQVPTTTQITLEQKDQYITHYYAMFQDIHVMAFIGFGFLMTFLKKYGYSAVGFNFLVAAFVLQWATLTGGWLLYFDQIDKKIYINMATLINADYAADAILISFGAVLGTISSLQLIIMALIEVVAYQVNLKFLVEYLRATDVGCSMYVHTFGAYFGIGVSWVTYRKAVHEAADKEGSNYVSDIFSILGTIFLWLFWPSFNGAMAVDEGRLRGVLNTYYALTGSAVVSFAMSSLVTKDKYSMVHIQNATLAGAVAVGTMADMIIHPWGALLVGAVGGAISVLGYRFVTPFLNKYLKIHDTCGVHNLHGMPGLISGLGSCLAAGLATPEIYGVGLTKIFAAGRSQSQLAAFQAAALFTSFGMGLLCGAFTGLILRIPIWNKPNVDEIFDDEQSWLLPNQDDDGSEQGQFAPNHNEAYSNSMEMPRYRSKDA